MQAAVKSAPTQKRSKARGEGEGNETKRLKGEGEGDAAKGLEEIETDVAVEVGVGEDAVGVSAAKSELAASEKRRDARFWLFVNL